MVRLQMRPIIITISLGLILAVSAHADTREKIIAGAYEEIRNETRYNSDMLEKYFPPTFTGGQDTGKAVYPNGDVNPKEGVCTDLIVRALRHAGIDLQESVHRDILSAKKAYGVKTADKYIDQRRVWILKTYFKRHWENLSPSLDNPKGWLAGDIVIWDIDSKRHLHIGIVGRKRRADGLPYVIHNMAYLPLVFAGKTIEQDVLEGPDLLSFQLGKWRIIGHYRCKIR